MNSGLWTEDRVHLRGVAELPNRETASNGSSRSTEMPGVVFSREHGAGEAILERGWCAVLSAQAIDGLCADCRDSSQLIVRRRIVVPSAEAGQVDLVAIQHLVQLAAVLSGLLGRAADVPPDALQQRLEVVSRPAFPRFTQMRDLPSEGGLRLVAFLLENQILGTDPLPRRQQDRLPEYVPQLANVAGPGVRQELRHCLLR